MERAILQEVVRGTDGVAVTREAHRPDEVRAMARRLYQWRDVPEGCSRCRQRNAVAVRCGLSVCAQCRTEMGAKVVPFVRATVKAPAFRMDEEGSSRIVGYPIIFNRHSENLGGFIETVLPEAGNRIMSAGAPDLRALWNHDSGEILGRQSAGTLSVSVDTVGVHVRISPPKWAARYVESLQRKDVTGGSFGFMVLEDDWHLENGMPHRELIDIDVSEISAVSFPAYPDTKMTAEVSSGRSLSYLERWHKNQAAR